jgi:hypothetical protein
MTASPIPRKTLTTPEILSTLHNTTIEQTILMLNYRVLLEHKLSEIFNASLSLHFYRTRQGGVGLASDIVSGAFGAVIPSVLVKVLNAAGQKVDERQQAKDLKICDAFIQKIGVSSIENFTKEICSRMATDKITDDLQSQDLVKMVKKDFDKLLNALGSDEVEIPRPITALRSLMPNFDGLEDREKRNMDRIISKILEVIKRPATPKPTSKIRRFFSTGGGGPSSARTNRHKRRLSLTTRVEMVEPQQFNIFVSNFQNQAIAEINQSPDNPENILLSAELAKKGLAKPVINDLIDYKEELTVEEKIQEEGSLKKELELLTAPGCEVDPTAALQIITELKALAILRDKAKIFSFSQEKRELLRTLVEAAEKEDEEEVVTGFLDSDDEEEITGFQVSDDEEEITGFLNNEGEEEEITGFTGNEDRDTEFAGFSDNENNKINGLQPLLLTPEPSPNTTGESSEQEAGTSNKKEVISTPLPPTPSSSRNSSPIDGILNPEEAVNYEPSINDISSIFELSRKMTRHKTSTQYAPSETASKDNYDDAVSASEDFHVTTPFHVKTPPSPNPSLTLGKSLEQPLIVSRMVFLDTVRSKLGRRKWSLCCLLGRPDPLETLLNNAIERAQKNGNSITKLEKSQDSEMLKFDDTTAKAITEANDALNKYYTSNKKQNIVLNAMEELRGSVNLRAPRFSQKAWHQNPMLQNHQR